jgi:hypothetical protein
MNLTQAMEISKKAKESGLSVRAEKGKVQLVKVSLDVKGKSTVTPCSDWIDYSQAITMLGK